MNAIILRRRKLGRTSCREIAAAMKSEIAVVRNDAHVPAVDFVFRWGTTSNVPKTPGQKVLNSAASIHWCADKKASRLVMQDAGIPVPHTFEAAQWLGHDALAGYGVRDLFVLRRAKHAQGKDLWHGDAAYIARMIREKNVYDGYVSRLINKVAEYRVFVCQGRVVWVAKKTPGNPDQVAWNVAQGGEFNNVRWGEWHMPSCRAAILAALLSKTDFCGVDVMVDADGNPYVLEVNSAPSQTSPYRQQCVAKAFDYIIKNGNEVIPCEKFKKWSDVAHPAILPAD